MTCPPNPTSGVAARTEGHSRAMASESLVVSVILLPRLIPSRCCDPGITTITFVPSCSNWLCTRLQALCPSETIVETAAMPMTRPSTVSPARILFRARARRAMRRVRKSSIVTASRLLPRPAGSGP